MWKNTLVFCTLTILLTAFVLAHRPAPTFGDCEEANTLYDNTGDEFIQEIEAVCDGQIVKIEVFTTGNLIDQTIVFAQGNPTPGESCDNSDDIKNQLTTLHSQDAINTDEGPDAWQEIVINSPLNVGHGEKIFIYLQDEPNIYYYQGSDLYTQGSRWFCGTNNNYIVSGSGLGSGSGSGSQIKPNATWTVRNGDQTFRAHIVSPPVFLSGATNPNGTSVELTFDKILADPAGKQGEFSIYADGTAHPADSVRLKSGDPKTIELTLTNAIRHGQAVTANYARGTVKAEDNSMPNSFGPVGVTNNVPANRVDLSVSSDSGTEAAESVITVTVNASAPVVGQQKVDIAVGGANITAGDYSLTAATITIADNFDSGSVAFTVKDDSLYEGEETAVLTISNPSDGIVLGDIISRNIVISDDDPPPAANFASSSRSVAETAGAVTLAVRLSEASGLDSVIPFAVSGTADGGGADYTIAPPSPLKISAGDTSADIVISVAADSVDEQDETVVLDLDTPQGATLGADARHILTILDDDVSGIAVSQPTEATEGGSSASYTVSLDTDPSSGDVTVVATSADTAQCTVSPDSLTLNAGNLLSTITVTAVEDTAAEGRHACTIIHSVTGGPPEYPPGMVVASAEVNIVDNDPGVIVEPPNINVSEGGGTASYAVRLATRPAAPIIVTVAPDSQLSVDKTALTFNDALGAQTVTVRAMDDDMYEGDHHGMIIHTIDQGNGDGGDYPAGMDISGIDAAIVDDDEAPSVADIEILKQTSKESAAIFENVVYTVAANNLGEYDATDVLIRDVLQQGVSLLSASASVGEYDPDSGLWTIERLAANSSATLELSVRIELSGVIENTAVLVSTTPPDPEPSNDSDTVSTTIADDGDLVSNQTEDSGPNNGDGNFDGIPDSRQANVTTLPSATGNVHITVESASGCMENRNVRTASEESFDNDLHYEYPFGIIGFDFPCSPVDVKVYFHGVTGAEDLIYKKFGPLPENWSAPLWYALDEAKITRLKIDGVETIVAEFTLRAGEKGDDTPGLPIADPGGLARYSPTPTFIPSLNTGGKFAFALLLTVITIFAIGRRKKES